MSKESQTLAQLSLVAFSYFDVGSFKPDLYLSSMSRISLFLSVNSFTKNDFQTGHHVLLGPCHRSANRLVLNNHFGPLQ